MLPLSTVEAFGPTVPEVVGAGGKGLLIVGYHQWKEREPGCLVPLPVVGTLCCGYWGGESSHLLTRSRATLACHRQPGLWLVLGRWTVSTGIPSLVVNHATRRGCGSLMHLPTLHNQRRTAFWCVALGACRAQPRGLHPGADF